MNDQFVSAKDIILDIQAFARQPINYPIYACLSREFKDRLKAAFMQRCGNTQAATAAWETFSAGESTTAGPIGADLLLGCTAVWGLESVSFWGYSVIHLA
jgi:hypothetical protein